MEKGNYKFHEYRVWCRTREVCIYPLGLCRGCGGGGGCKVGASSLGVVGLEFGEGKLQIPCLQGVVPLMTSVYLPVGSV